MTYTKDRFAARGHDLKIRGKMRYHQYLRMAAMAAGCAISLGSAQAATALKPDDVKKLFAQTASANCKFEWKNIQIAAARRASVGEIRAAGMPPNAVVTPVRAEYTQLCKPGFTRDYRWNYYFYQDDFGAWTKQSNAMPGNYESDPR